MGDARFADQTAAPIQHELHGYVGSFRDPHCRQTVVEMTEHRTERIRGIFGCRRSLRQHSGEDQ
jgi:hypothetical protein